MRNACLLIPCNNQQASGHKPCSNSDLNLQVSSGLAGVPAGRAPEVGSHGCDKRPDSRERPALYGACLLILSLLALDCHAQSGVAIAEQGLITIEGLTLTSGAAYTALELTK